jgi:GntR family transcriptional regulator, rspAB operon transcriptional repressor
LIIDNPSHQTTLPRTRPIRLPAVADALRRRIVLNDLAPGTVLTELAIAAEFGRSQGAVREALLRLEGEGLLTRSGHQGTAVTTLDAKEAAEMLALRRRLEGRAARAVVRRATAADRARLDGLLAAMEQAAAEGDLWRMIEADMAFHLALYDVAGLHALTPILARSLLHTQRFRLWAPWHDRPLAVTAARHRPILERLAAGDAAGLRRALERHVDTIVEHPA